MNNPMDGLDLSHVQEIPGGEAFQKGVNEFNKKAAGAAYSYIKRNFGTLTEGFFRLGMGDRYFTRGTYTLGIIIWSFGIAAAAIVSPYCCLGYLFAAAAEWTKISHILSYRIVGGAFPTVLLFIYWRFGAANLGFVKICRNQGKPYHSRSRGLPIFGDRERRIYFLWQLILLFCNWPLGIVFGIGYWLNAKLKSDQEAAVWSRYLDAQDAECEKEFLEMAALGTAPTEMTYLAKPLDPGLNPEVRQNVAGSLVGKPVKIAFKKEPRGGASFDQVATEQGSSSPAAAAPQTKGGKRGRMSNEQMQKYFRPEKT